MAVEVGNLISTVTVTDGKCPSCGNPYMYVGDWSVNALPPICQCATKRVLGLNAGTIKTSPDFDEPLELVPARDAWECPRCHRINAPWKATCDCVPPLPSGISTAGYYIRVVPREGK